MPRAEPEAPPGAGRRVFLSTGAERPLAQPRRQKPRLAAAHRPENTATETAENPDIENTGSATAQ